MSKQDLAEYLSRIELLQNIEAILQQYASKLNAQCYAKDNEVTLVVQQNGFTFSIKTSSLEVIDES